MKILVLLHVRWWWELLASAHKFTSMPCHWFEAAGLDTISYRERGCWFRHHLPPLDTATVLSSPSSLVHDSSRAPLFLIASRTSTSFMCVRETRQIEIFCKSAPLPSAMGKNAILQIWILEPTWFAHQPGRDFWGASAMLVVCSPTHDRNFPRRRVDDLQDCPPHFPVKMGFPCTYWYMIEVIEVPFVSNLYKLEVDWRKNTKGNMRKTSTNQRT